VLLLNRHSVMLSDGAHETVTRSDPSRIFLDANTDAGASDYDRDHDSKQTKRYQTIFITILEIIMDEEIENAYEILGLAENATTPEIHKAYIKLCRQWHPDKGRNEADIRERTIRMFQLNAARAILTDNVKRAVHDAVLQSRRDGTYEPPDRGSGYKNEGGFRFSSKPRPSGLATPYRGDRTTPETYECHSDGTDGIDGLPGRPGWGGNGYGGHGT
jgi:hypothetical protein